MKKKYCTPVIQETTMFEPTNMLAESPLAIRMTVTDNSGFQDEGDFEIFNDNSSLVTIDNGSLDNKTVNQT